MKTTGQLNLKWCVLCTSLVLTFAAALNARAQEGKTDHSNDKYAVFWTSLYDHAMYTHLGPTGLWGWVHGNKAYVHRVDQGSPADGLIERNDVIIGAFGTLFPQGEDGRRHLGNAITRAESTAEHGKLKLIALQNGEKKNITLQLAILGNYAEGWPFDCQKSKKIVDNACAYLAAEQLPNGHFPSDSEIGQPIAGLLLLAGDDPRYLDNARRAAYWIVDNPYLGGLPSWTWGYRCIFLSEYYLATGDRIIRLQPPPRATLHRAVYLQ